MKIKITTVIALLSLASWPVRSDEPMKPPMDTTTPPASWSTLEKQAADMASAVQAQNVHPLHKIDHAVADETAELQKSEPAALSADQKTKLARLLEDMAKQAHRAHMDGHKANWGDATAAQKQFGVDLKEAEVILPSAK